jgi:hypothetical protein
LIVSGNGEVIEPDDGIAAIGSGGSYGARGRPGTQAKYRSAGCRDRQPLFGLCRRYLRFYQSEYRCGKSLGGVVAAYDFYHRLAAKGHLLGADLRKTFPGFRRQGYVKADIRLRITLY